MEITAQNHGFAVEEQTLPADLEITHRNLNDNTVAGMRHRKLPAFSVQYHPEASAGPHDSRYLFEQFRRMLRAFVIDHYAALTPKVTPFSCQVVGEGRLIFIDLATAETGLVASTAEIAATTAAAASAATAATTAAT